MPEPKMPRTNWLLLVLVSAIPRAAGAFFLPNGFGDAYVYIRDIGNLSTRISTGSFQLTDLFGFWLPLYQLIAALLNVFIKNGFYSGKLISAFFGIGVCLFVYAITTALTGRSTAALAIFLLIALNPLHIFYSASAMTDVPHAFFVLGALYFVIRQKWIIAAIFAALAGLTRVESWMLIALIPIIHFMRERRVSVIALLIMILPPVFWFYVSWKATGRWLACFEQRQQYHDWLLRMNPAIAGFSVTNVLRDCATLLVSSDIAVLIACFVAGWFVLRQLLAIRRQKLSEATQAILPPVIFFFAFLGLLLAAYLTHQQPIIFPRYGLILFTLGLPVLAWTFFHLKEQSPSWARRLLIGIVTICFLDAGIQFAGAVGTVNQYYAQRAVAEYLRDHFDPKSGGMIFSDEGTVKVMSGIAEDRFLSSADAPGDRESFLRFLRQEKVEYLVFFKKDDSIPAKLFPDAQSGEAERFEMAIHSYTDFLPTDIWLYRIRNSREPAALQDRER